MDKILKATHQGELDLNGFKISCAVLEDGRRVLVNRSLATALGIKGSGAYWQRKKEGKGAMLPEYISAKYLKPFISEELHVKLTEPISYESSKGVEAEGVEADLLADICDTFVKANEKGALRNNTHIADNAYQMILAFAKVGITALVDEVTGIYFKFYMLIFKLKGWEYTLKHIKTGQRPGVVGKWTKKYIYSALPKGVLPTLLNLTDRGSDGRLKTKLFQHLTLEDGIKALEKQIDNIVLLMEVSKDWKDFDRLWNAKYGQKEIPFSEQHLLEPKKKELSDYDKSLKKALDYNPKK